MNEPLFSDDFPASLSAPSEPAVARLICALSAETGLSKRLVAIAQLGEQLVAGPHARRARILEALCAFIRARAPLVGLRSLRSVPARDVQAALNVLASRPRQQGPNRKVIPLDLRDSDLTGAWLASADLRFARFDRSSLRMVDLSYADLEAASFRDADLGGATLAHSRLTRAELGGARLHNVDLTGAAIAEPAGFNVQRAMAS